MIQTQEVAEGKFHVANCTPGTGDNQFRFRQFRRFWERSLQEDKYLTHLDVLKEYGKWPKALKWNFLKKIAKLIKNNIITSLSLEREQKIV